MTFDCFIVLRLRPQFSVPSSINDQLLLDIRTMGYCGVRIEAMKRSSVVQCRNCQRLHHATGQCNFKYRCVQCIVPHEYGNCPRPSNPSLPIGCINCFEEKLPHGERYAELQLLQDGPGEKGRTKNRHWKGKCLPGPALGRNPSTNARANATGTVVKGLIFAQATAGSPAPAGNAVGDFDLTVQGVLAALRHTKNAN